MAKRKLKSVDRAFTIKRLLLILLAAAVLAGGFFGVRAFLKSRASFGSVTSLPFYSEASYAYSDSVFYYADGDKLVIYNPSSPDSSKSMSLGTSDVSVAAANGTAALYSSSAVQIIGTDSIIDVGGQIAFVRCAANHIAVLRMDSAGDYAVLVYNKSGSLVDIIEQGDGIITDCGFYDSSSGDLMWTLILSTSADTPVTTLTTYSYATQGSESVATMSGVISVNSQIVDKVVFTKNSIFISGTEQLIRCDASISGESWRLLTYGYRLSDYSTASTKPLFLFVPRNEDGMNEAKLYSVEESATSSATARTVQLSDGVHSVMAYSGKMAAFSTDTLYIYTAAGKLSGTYALDFSCVKATKLSENEALCECADGSLKLLTLK